VTWTHDLHHSPLSFVLTRFSLQVFGQGEWQLRLPSLAFSVANLLLAYRLGSLLLNRRSGLLLAALLSFSTLLVVTDSYARCYPLLLFLVFLVYFEIVGMGTVPEEAHVARWLRLGLLLALAFWVHPLALYVWIAVFFSFLLDFVLCRKLLMQSQLWPIATRLVACFGLAVSLSVVGLLKMLGMTGSVRGPEPERPGFLHALIEFAGTSAYPLMYLAAIVGLALLMTKRRQFALHMLMLVASGLAIVFAGQRNHHVVGHYFYPLAVPIYLGLTCVANRFLDQTRRWKMVYFASVLLVLHGLAWRAVQSYRMVRSYVASTESGWEGSRLIQYAAKYATPQDMVAFIPPWMDDRARFYGLQARWPSLCFDGDRWPQGYGYLASEIDVPGDASLWILVETRYKVGPKEPWCVAALERLIPRVFRSPLSRDQLDALLRNNVLRITREGISGLNSHDVKEILDGARPSEPPRSVVRAGIANVHN